MGRYIKPSDMDSYLAAIMGSFTIPNTDDLDVIIESLETRLDAGFQRWGVAVPLTDARDIGLVRNPLIEGTACKAWDIYVDADTAAQTRRCSSWEDFISRVETGKVKLPSTGDDQTTTSGAMTTIPIVRNYPPPHRQREV